MVLFVLYDIENHIKMPECRRKVSPASAFLLVVSCISLASRFWYQGSVWYHLSRISLALSSYATTWLITHGFSRTAAGVFLAPASRGFSAPPQHHHEKLLACWAIWDQNSFALLSYRLRFTIGFISVLKLNFQPVGNTASAHHSRLWCFASQLPPFDQGQQYRDQK